MLRALRVSPSLAPEPQRNRAYPTGALSKGSRPTPQGSLSGQPCWEGTSDGPQPGMVTRAMLPAQVALCRRSPHGRRACGGSGGQGTTCMPRAPSPGWHRRLGLAGLPPRPRRTRTERGRGSAGLRHCGAPYSGREPPSRLCGAATASRAEPGQAEERRRPELPGDGSGARRRAGGLAAGRSRSRR